MKHLRRICCGLFLMTALSIPALAGDGHGPGSPEPGQTETPPAPAPGDTQGPNIMGELQTPGLTAVLNAILSVV